MGWGGVRTPADLLPASLSVHTDLHQLNAIYVMFIQPFIKRIIHSLSNYTGIRGSQNNKFICCAFLQLSVPDKVLIPERYVESDPEEVLSPEQEADKQRKVDRIKALIVKNR